jgi:RNA polymerase sigma-70 factor (ECF subfamily)
VASGSGHLEITDLELVSRARRGDSAAFHDLLDRHASYLFGVAVSLMGNAADAEDAVQETLLGAFRGMRGFEGRSSVKTWLTSILIRQTAMRHRSAGRRPATSIESVAEVACGPSASSSTEATDTRIDLMAAIQELSPDHREVVVLRELNGLSYDEIAEALDVPRGTVESRLFRARRQLQERLQEYLV